MEEDFDGELHDINAPRDDDGGDDDPSDDDAEDEERIEQKMGEDLGDNQEVSRAPCKRTQVEWHVSRKGNPVEDLPRSIFCLLWLHKIGSSRK